MTGSCHIARIRARRMKVQLPEELQIPENDCNGILNTRPGISVPKLYVIVTSLKTNVPSGSALGVVVPLFTAWQVVPVQI